jgi:transcriptional regulator with XRE-family HTH domain
MGKTQYSKKPTRRRRVHKSWLKVSSSGNYFGQTLKELRLQRDLTQGEAAGLLKISQAQWSGYEVGSSKPTLDTIISIAEKFEIDPLVLIGKSLDKFKFPGDPEKQLSFLEYDKISKDIIENYRKNRLKIRLQGV